MPRASFIALFLITVFPKTIAQTLFIVDRLTDNNSITGEGLGNSGDLRYCISMAGTNTESKITFATDGEYFISNSLPGISSSIIIDSEENNIIVNGQSLYRIFTIFNTGNLVLNSINLYSGFVEYPSEGGGAILNYGQLTATHCNFVINKSDDAAGVLSNQTNANAFLSLCLFSNNNSGGFGGAVYNNNGNMTIGGCKFEQNSSSSADGAVSDYGNMLLQNSEFIDNGSYYGAAAYGVGNDNTTHLAVNCIFYNNGSEISTLVPAIRNTANLTLINNSIYSNVGNGVLNDLSYFTPVSLTIINTIIATDSYSYTNLEGTVTGSSYNNILYGYGDHNLENGVNGNITNIPSADSIFYMPGSYYRYGLSLAPFSKAIDGGILSLSGFSIPQYDQKDSLRTEKPDIGAIEYQKLTQTITFDPISEIEFSLSPYQVQASASSGIPIDYYVTGSAIVMGENLSLTGIGTLTIVGIIPNTKYFYADTSAIEINVVQGSQSIPGLSDLTDLSFSGSSFIIALPQYASSGLPVDYSLTTDPIENIASITGNQLNIFGSGSITINAIQNGNDNFYSASATVTFLATQVIDSIPVIIDTTVTPTIVGANFLNDFETESIKIYPNPSSGSFIVSYPKACIIYIYNSQGIKFREIELNQEPYKIYLNNKGAYLLRLTSNNKTIYRKLLVE